MNETFRHVVDGGDGAIAALARISAPLSQVVAARPQRPVLLLQGPLGGFFGALAQAFVTAGIPVHSVHFNLADRGLRRTAGTTTRFRGDLDAWKSWLEEFCAANRPRCIIVFGDQRNWHRVAGEVAGRLGIRFFSFEEGYVRPNFITLEEGGNNALSSFPQDPAEWADITQFADVSPVGGSFPRVAWWASCYYWTVDFERWMTGELLHHRHRLALHEALLWIRSYYRKLRWDPVDQALIRRLARDYHQRYFVVALQVHDDLQMEFHAAGWTQEMLIEQSIAAFARVCTPDQHLVIRYHPMDRGRYSYGPLVKAVAREHGVAARVHLTYAGHGPTLLDHAAGCITINSTMALSSMFHRCPVLALGRAFFRIPGLAVAGAEPADIAAFLKAPPPVNFDLFLKFRANLVAHSQIHGSYYVPRLHAKMAQDVIARLEKVGALA